MQKKIEIPTLLFWENGNSWYGSKGETRFFIEPVETENAGRELAAEVWRGPMTKELSEILGRNRFPLSEDGLREVTEWLEQWSAQLSQ